MSRSPNPPILAQLRSASSAASQANALRNLRNEIIGHEQKKEAWVKLGLVPQLLRVLSSSSQKTQPSADTRSETSQGMSWQDDRDEATLQATVLIGCLAHGGPALVAPIFQTPIPFILLDFLNPSQTRPVLLLETLRSLNTIADALALARPGSALSCSLLSDQLFQDDGAHNLVGILVQPCSSPLVQQQISWAASLISKLCREERHRVALANAGALDALGTRLAGFVVAMGFVLPSADHATRGSDEQAIPDPAPQTAELYIVLDAITSVMHNSKFRASQLLYCPAITSVFPPVVLDPGEGGQLAPFVTDESAHSQEQDYASILDLLLPEMYSPEKNTSAQSSAFPPLGSNPSASKTSSTLPAVSTSTWPGNKRGAAADATSSSSEADTQEEVESPLVSWLIHLTRTEYGINRVMAASVLAELYQNGLVSKKRETMLALLVIPIMVRMLEDSFTLPSSMLRYPPSNDRQWTENTIRERVPAILAVLMADSAEMQKAAVESNVIKQLCQMLKSAYDPVPKQSKMWSPNPQSVGVGNIGEPSGLICLGDPGLPPQYVHKVAVRESTLKALAALTPSRDDYRKMVLDNSITPLLVESLKQYDEEQSTASFAGGADMKQEQRPMTGNPSGVLIAACSLVRSLSRSVNILRTSLIDAGIAIPLFVLLTSSDIEVQIAATAAACNVLLEFSPMKEAITEAGGLKILCDHAHSSDPRLRLNAIWALKHLVFHAEKDLKVSCIEELGQSWLIQLILSDTDDPSQSSAGLKGQVDSNMEVTYTPGEYPSLVNLVESRERLESSFSCKSQNVHMGDVPNDNHPGTQSRRGSNDTSRPGTGRAHHATNLDAKLALLREAERNGAKRAHRDDVAVQEQCLDLIRNIIVGPKSDEMIDLLFNMLGQDRLFDILASKLRPKLAYPSNAHAHHHQEHAQNHSGPSTTSTSTHGAEPRLIPPSTEIIVAVCSILVNIAASHPRHRNRLVAQTHLLKLLPPLFAHPSKHVRSALAWLCINLTWVDDEQMQPACAARAAELRRLGFKEALQTLLQDKVLDISEKAKIAYAKVKDADGA